MKWPGSFGHCASRRTESGAFTSANDGPAGAFCGAARPLVISPGFAYHLASSPHILRGVWRKPPVELTRNRPCRQFAFSGDQNLINWDDHNPPHFHAVYGGLEMSVLIDSAEPMSGDLPPNQRKMVLAWAVLHREELFDDWTLAEKNQFLFPIDPLR